MLTQADIAEKVKVSRSAVAFALSDDPHAKKQISPQTRQRIVETARELGYRPHRHAQLMRGKKSGIIGILQFGGALDLSEKRAISATRAIQVHHYRPLVNHAHWYQQGFREALEALVDARIEGLILMNPSAWFPVSAIEEVRRLRIPVVGMDGVRLPAVPQVRSDVRQGMFDLTRHLLGLGHRRLVLLTQWEGESPEKTGNWPILERVAGFQDAVTQFRQSAGGGQPADVVAEVVNEETPIDWLKPYEIGRDGMSKLLRWRERPQVVLCSNDYWAHGALAACAAAGVPVPEAMAVTGFDNEVFGEYGSVPLTTVAQPAEPMAQTTVELLAAMMRGEQLSASQELVKLPCQLVVRQSCGAAVRRPQP